MGKIIRAISEVLGETLPYDNSRTQSTIKSSCSKFDEVWIGRRGKFLCTSSRNGSVTGQVSCFKGSHRCNPKNLDRLLYDQFHLKSVTNYGKMRANCKSTFRCRLQKRIMI